MLSGSAISWQRSPLSACKPCQPRACRRPLSPASLIVLLGWRGCSSVSWPTTFRHTWLWFCRLHSAMPITNRIRLSTVQSRTRRVLLLHGSLLPIQRSITSGGYTRLNIVGLTCSHTLSSRSISRNLYIESSFVCIRFWQYARFGAFCLLFPPFWP